MSAAARVVSLVLAYVLGFVLVAEKVTDLRGSQVTIASAATPEYGEAVFWGKGTCGTCHYVGSRGSNRRCPDQEGLALRAAERAAATGTPFTAADYLVESLADPSAYVAKGLPDGLMPLVYLPPVDLAPDDVEAVLLYLQTLGGEPDPAEVRAAMRRHGQRILTKAGAKARGAPAVRIPDPSWEILQPSEIQKAAALGDTERERFLGERLDAARRSEYEEIVTDWLAEGEEAYETLKCWQCHVIEGKEFGPLEQGKVGPDLTSIGTIQGPAYLLESILNPNAMIVPPLADHAGEDGRSKMPDFNDSVTGRQLARLVFFLRNLKAPPPAPPSEGGVR